MAGRRLVLSVRNLDCWTMSGSGMGGIEREREQKNRYTDYIDSICPSRRCEGRTDRLDKQ